MAANNVHTPEVRWDQSGFEKLKATWSPERIAEDEKRLKEIFALAAYSPTMKRALDWANDHGIQFFIDRECVRVAGYYPWGSGVFAIADRSAHPSSYIVNTITHELRHAEQDYQGFPVCDGLNTEPGNFAEQFITNALVEADAKAIGDLAGEEYRIAKRNKENEVTGQPALTGLSSAEDKNAFLRNAFLNWFSSSHTTQFYGDYLSQYLGQKWGVYEGQLKEWNVELKGPNPRLEGINLNNINDVLRLGANFSGTGNYLAELPPDILPKKILRPSLADTFWGASNVEQRVLTQRLRKAYLEKKLAPENRKKHHAWP